MREESELKSDIETAKQASALINHPLFIASLNTLESVTNDKFKSLGFESTIEMQECNIRLKLIDEFKENLFIVISNGNSAFQSLEDIQSHNKAMKK